jgi:uncharacterized membrane protein YphA (DoxX/SURF4 family)
VGTAATVAGIILGAAFVLAGAAKLAAGRSWLAQAEQLGAPASMAPLVPWVELGVGALLVTQVAVPWPAVAAIVLLVCFTALIALRLSRGERPPCACFGNWSAKPIGPVHIARNAALMMLGMLALFG